MKLDTIAPTIVISDALLGWNVAVIPALDPDHYDDWFDRLQYARAYARGLHAGSGWEIEDLATLFPAIVPFPSPQVES